MRGIPRRPANDEESPRMWPGLNPGRWPPELPGRRPASRCGESTSTVFYSKANLHRAQIDCADSDRVVACRQSEKTIMRLFPIAVLGVLCLVPGLAAAISETPAGDDPPRPLPVASQRPLEEGPAWYV